MLRFGFPFDEYALGAVFDNRVELGDDLGRRQRAGPLAVLYRYESAVRTRFRIRSLGRLFGDGRRRVTSDHCRFRVRGR